MQSRLLDARSTPDDWAAARADISTATLLGIDCETQDEARHAGLNSYNNGTRHVFDHRRTTMTGFSFYSDGAEQAWYVNLAHADVVNRITWEQAKTLLDLVPASCLQLAHNAPFELVMFEQCHGYKLQNVVCTLQLAVTHHGPDEYNLQTFAAAPLSGFATLAKEVGIVFADYDGTLNGAQSELLGKFIAKESKAAHSYNGFVASIKIGYDLKTLTKSRFGVEQLSYKDLLKRCGATHMGQLTGDQVCEYGADDAYWAVQHYKWMRDDLLANNPAVLVTFFKTENPMVYVYAEQWRDGLRLDLEQVYERQRLERIEMANVLRRIKGRIKALLPFPEEPNERLLAKEDWYAKGWVKKRAQIAAWAMSADDKDDFKQCFQVSNPIGNAWAIEQGVKVPSAGKLNLVYYHGMRTLLYDLCGARVVYDQGAICSDAEARGKMRDQLERDGKTLQVEVLGDLQKMAEIEQRMKLYLTPYTQLMDPETGHVYPSLSSMLATRRLAMSYPNGMQLDKTSYVRSFFLADDDEAVVCSADWSAVELVLIGDKSGDPGFKEVYGQLPYGDLHTGAAADCLAVKTLPGLTEAEYKEFKFGRNPNNRELKHIVTGEIVSPEAYYKFTRGTPVGKGANFSYWYSGALSTVGETLGWNSEEMWAAVDNYRNRFPLAEQWRVAKGLEGVQKGFITLADHHRRVRMEATPMWKQTMLRKFGDLSAMPGMEAYAELACKRIQGRSKNQLVNADIQGTCATMAKRSILRVRELVREAGIEDRVRFMMPIHDELVYSVHKSVVMTFIPILRRAMCEHPDLVKTLPLNCSVAMGRTFRPYDNNNPAFSQIELDEVMKPIPGLLGPELEGTKLNDNKVEEVLDYMFRKAA